MGNHTAGTEPPPQPRQTVDDACIAAAARGDNSAWTLIYNEFATTILSYLRMHRTPDPEDVLGDVFLDAARSILRFEGTAPSFRSWLFTIAHHRMVDRVRKATRTPASEFLDHGSNGSEYSDTAPGPGVDERVIERLNIEQVRSLLDQLAPDQRDVFLLVYVADLSLVDAAKALGKTNGSVKALHVRGIASLRRMLTSLSVLIL